MYAMQNKIKHTSQKVKEKDKSLIQRMAKTKIKIWKKW
jgi:hypothetical protein